MYLTKIMSTSVDLLFGNWHFRIFSLFPRSGLSRARWPRRGLQCTSLGGFELDGIKHNEPHHDSVRLWWRITVTILTIKQVKHQKPVRLCLCFLFFSWRGPLLQEVFQSKLRRRKRASSDGSSEGFWVQGSGCTLRSCNLRHRAPLLLSAGFPVVSYWQSFQGVGIAGWKTKQLQVYFNHLERRVNLKFFILPHSKPAQKWGSQRDPGLGSSSLISLDTDDSKMGCFSVFVRSLLADPWKCYVQLKELQRVMCWGKMLLFWLICFEQAACLWLMSQMCGFCRVFLIRLKMVSSQLP